MFISWRLCVPAGACACHHVENLVRMRRSKFIGDTVLDLVHAIHDLVEDS